MRQKSDTTKPSSEQVVKDIRRATRRHRSAEEKIRIGWNLMADGRDRDSICAPTV
jgi:hypothetical protein